MRNVHVGWFFRHAGTACRVLPRETWRCVPRKSYGGERGGKGQKREREVCARVRVWGDKGEEDKGFPRALPSPLAKRCIRCKRNDMTWRVDHERNTPLG